MKAWRAIRRRLRARLAMWRAARVTDARLSGSPVRRVLVVCYGNIYRSPFVAESLRGRLPAGVEVRSGGFHQKVGRPSPEAHVSMSAALGVRLENHRSVCLGAGDLAWADTIVLMDRHNWLALDERGADPGKFVWLGVLAGGPVEIDDPYGKDAASAERLIARLQRGADVFAERVRSAARG